MKENMKNLVQKYINGEEIPESVLKDLEKDKKFMMEVIKASKDKKIYNLCAEVLKKDYEFIKYLILTFKDDVNFITMVANEYLNTNPKQEEVIELSVIMDDIIGYTVDNDFYQKKLQENINVKQQIYANKKKNKLNKTSLFKTNKDKYFNNKIITDYYAKVFLYEYFRKYYTYLQNILVCKYLEAKDNVNKEDLTNILLEFIKNIDDDLSNYLKNNSALLEWYLKQLERRYLEMQAIDTSLEDDMYESLYNVSLEAKDLSPLLGENIIYYAFKETNLLDQMIKRGYIDFGAKEDIEQELEKDDNINMDKYLAELKEEIISHQEEGWPNPYIVMPPEEFYTYLNNNQEDLTIFNKLKSDIQKVLKTSSRTLKKEIKKL